jgi:hypothetical protein
MESAEVLRGMGGDVNAVLYPGMDHTVSQSEIEEVRRLVVPLGGAHTAAERGGGRTGGIE